MEVKKVVIIHSDAFTKEEIVEDLKTECYTHDFFFCDNTQPNRDNISEADEIWLFGFVGNTPAFYMACELGADFWTMG